MPDGMASNENDPGRGALRALPRIDDPDESHELALFTTLARTGLFLDALQRDCLGRHGLTFTEFSVLRLLQRAPGRRCSPSGLAEEIVCTSGAMTKLVDRLQRSGLVTRMPAPTDRRGVLVQLTAAGDVAVDAAGETYRRGRERVLERLEDSEVKDVHAGLARLLEALEGDRHGR